MSSILMIGLQMTPHGKKANSHLVGMLKGVKENAKRKVATSMPESLQDVIGTVPVAANNVSDSTNEYVFNDEQYVLINGKYYKARADNTYDVDGEKVYYVSDRRKRGNASTDQIPQVPAGVPQGYPEDTEIKMPTSPGEMMETLKKAQESMKARNQMLKQMEQDGY